MVRAQTRLPFLKSRPTGRTRRKLDPRHPLPMRAQLFVQVYECAEGQRRATHKLPIGYFMRHAFERLSPLEILQLRNDLTILGHSRIDGANGRWHEYVLTNTYVG